MKKEITETENFAEFDPEGQNTKTVLDDCSCAYKAGKMTFLIRKRRKGKSL